MKNVAKTKGEKKRKNGKIKEGKAKKRSRKGDKKNKKKRRKEGEEKKRKR